MKIAPARGASNGTGLVIIATAGAELYDATRTTAEEKGYIYSLAAAVLSPAPSQRPVRSDDAFALLEK